MSGGKHTPALKPCPVCGRAPDRFFVSQSHIEVIACPRGCKTHPLGFVIHITSRQVSGWSDLGDAWNTMEAAPRDDGMGLHVSFASVPPHIAAQLEPSGSFHPWSPAISARRIAERAAIAKATGIAA